MGSGNCPRSMYVITRRLSQPMISAASATPASVGTTSTVSVASSPTAFRSSSRHERFDVPVTSTYTGASRTIANHRPPQCHILARTGSATDRSYDGVLGEIAGSDSVVSSAEDPLAAELLPPALGVPVPPVIRRAVRDHHEVPGTRAHDVIAAGAPVSLFSGQMPNLVAGHLGPRWGRRPWPGVRRRQGLERGAPVLPRHRDQTRSRTNAATWGASDAPTARGSSFRERSNECPAPSKSTSVARSPSRRMTFASSFGSANGSFVPWRKSMGIVRSYRWVSRIWSVLPGAWSG